MRQKSRRFLSLRTKLTLAFTALTILCGALFIGITFSYFRGELRQNLKDSLRSQVAIAALQIDGDAHAMLMTTADQDSPAFTQIKEQLVKIQETAQGIASPYTMRETANGEIQFIVDATDPDPAAIGYLYSDPGPVLAEFSAITQPVVEDDFYTDEWGTWLSGYAPIYRSDGVLDGVLGFDIAADEVLIQERQLLLTSLLIFLAIIPVAVLLGFWFSRLLTAPVLSITRTARQIAGADLPQLASVAQAVAQGDLTRSASIEASEISVDSNDELGEMAAALNQMIAGLREMGPALGTMTGNLSGLVRRLASNAADLEVSSTRLSANADMAGQASTQIAHMIQNVANGIRQQSESVNRTAASMVQMTGAINNVAKGAQEQANAVNTTSAVTAQMTSMIQQVSGNAQSVASESAEAARQAHIGAGIVEETVREMQSIHTKTGYSLQRLQDLGKRSEEIGAIVETIDDIASQTNLLALNAAIETARAESQAEKMTEYILNKQMITQAQLLNQILLDKGVEFSPAFWDELTHRAHIDTISITDADGVVVYSDDTGRIGWRFPDDPSSQACEFRKLIGLQDGVVCQKPQQRSWDKRVFKFVGVSRLDEPGIVQVAFDADSVKNYELHLGGFAVVAAEVRKLAERSRTSTHEITTLIHAIQKTVDEAVHSMSETAQEVERGAEHSGEAGKALASILGAADTVRKQAEEATSAVTQMLAASNSLVHAMDSVSGVVEENTASTEQMAAGSGEVTLAMEMIARVSEKSNQAVDDSHASAEEMTGQIAEVTFLAQDLSEMAGQLRRAIAEFKLSDQAEGWSPQVEEDEIMEYGVKMRA